MYYSRPILNIRMMMLNDLINSESYTPGVFVSSAGYA
jgi:hypothetical protein